MKIVTFNVNSIRARLDSFQFLLQKHKPHIVGLQEIKATNQDFPLQKSQSWPYRFDVHGQKGYHGVAIASSIDPVFTKLGIDFEEDQSRFSYNQYSTTNGVLHFINIYFPQGDNRNHPKKFPYKLNFYQQLFKFVSSNFTAHDSLIIVGDFNIAPLDVDIGIGEDNKKRWLSTGKCSFLPEERELIALFFNWGLVDAYRYLYPQEQIYSWFDYRSQGFNRNPRRGLRIDYALCTKPLLNKLIAVDIDYQIRAMDRPSDHCPVVFDFDLNFA